MPQPGTESGPQGGDDSFCELMQTDEPNDSDQAIPQVTVQVQINRPNELGSKTKFVTPTANGNMRDILTVECPISTHETKPVVLQGWEVGHDKHTLKKAT